MRPLRLSRPVAVLVLAACLSACSVQHRLRNSADRRLLSDSALRHAHVGIAVFDPEGRRWLYTHGSDRYFVPASNTKIVTCYAALRHLGDTLDGIVWHDLDTALLLEPTGDPTLLHPDFPEQPVMAFLDSCRRPVYLDLSAWRTTPLGSGWSWDDYAASYMPERSPLPVHGNYVTWRQSTARKEHPADPADTVDVFITGDPEGPWEVDFGPGRAGRFTVGRDRDRNRFVLTEGRPPGGAVDVPFVTRGAATALSLLNERSGGRPTFSAWPADGPRPPGAGRGVRSVATDALLRPLMHRSDNFFAEQALLMVSRRLTGVFDESAAIDRLLATTFAGLPHPPRWADGSGLSRYNLFTPEDIIWVLDRLRADVGMDRLRHLLPTAGTGTLGSLDRRLEGRVLAKTGTLSGVVALSGYLRTRRDRWLLFSFLVNNHRTTATAVRKRFEAFLLDLYERG